MGLFKYPFAVVSGLFIAIACSNSSPSTDEGSEVKIVNGQKDVSNLFPNVVLLTVRTTRTFFSRTSEYCTGVITDANTVFAAAHCVKNLPNNTSVQDVYHGIQTTFQGKPVNAINGYAFHEPLNQQTIREDQVGMDLVILKFPAGSFPLAENQFAKLPTAGSSQQLAPQTTNVFLVGYGSTTFGQNSGRFDANNRNYGSNVLAGKSDRGYLTVTGKRGDASSKALANKGDSGGPLFLEDKVTLIGIGSALKIASDNEVTNYFTDLASEQSQSLIAFSQGRITSDQLRSKHIQPTGNAETLEAMCSKSDGGKSDVASQVTINSSKPNSI